MKKNKKLIKIIALTLIIIVTATIWAGTKIFGVTLYNMDAENILDNLSREGEQVIIPIIYKEPDVPITVDKVKADFNKKGLTIKNISTDNIIGTGTQITTNENKITYNMLVYGDVNGDGEVDLVDAQNIVLHLKYPDIKALTGLKLLAANISNKDDDVDLVDAQRIVLFLKFGNKLMEDLPKINQADIVKPTIYVKGSTRETIEIGSTYTDKGATAEDDFDGNIASKIETTGTVDTSKVGTYTIKYDVTDSAGNKAETKTRTVTVVDAIQSIETNTGLNVKTYNYAQDVSLTGASIKVNWKSGKTEVMNDTSKLTVLNYNSKTPGEQTIGIQYKTFKINQFDKVTVKNKIDTIALDTANKQNATIDDEIATIASGADTDVEVQTNRTFTLGKIIGVGDDLSTLDLSKLSVSVTSANKDDMESISITNTGLLTGKVQSKKPGDYTIQVKYVNENNENVIWTKSITAATNNLIADFDIEIEEHKVRKQNVNPVYTTITYYNANGETIDNTADRDNPILDDDVTITNDDASVTIIKCNADNLPVADNADKKVTALSLRTEYTSAQTVTFTVTIGDVTKDITFVTGATAIISGIYGLEPGNATQINISDAVDNETGESIATIIPLKIVDQYGEEIPITYSQINTLMNLTSNPETSLTGDYVVGIAARWPINTIRKYEGETVSSGSANPITQLGFAFEEDYDETEDLEHLYGDKATMLETLNGQRNIFIYLKAGDQILVYPIETNITITNLE